MLPFHNLFYSSTIFQGSGNTKSKTLRKSMTAPSSVSFANQNRPLTTDYSGRTTGNTTGTDNRSPSRGVQSIPALTASSPDKAAVRRHTAIGGNRTKSSNLQTNLLLLY